MPTNLPVPVGVFGVGWDRRHRRTIVVHRKFKYLEFQMFDCMEC